MPLPGSPFTLSVGPSAAHAPSTKLPASALPLRGIVGEDFSCSCVLVAADRMGNRRGSPWCLPCIFLAHQPGLGHWCRRCVEGSADVKVGINSTEVACASTDNGDGSYTLEWQSKISGTFKTWCTIGGAHVVGSPTQIIMLSGAPDVPKCDVHGAGLRTAIAGLMSVVEITCKDRFSNQLNADSMKGTPMRFGLALVPITGGDNRSQRDTVPSMPFEGQWVKSEKGETVEGRAPGGEYFKIQWAPTPTHPRAPSAPAASLRPFPPTTRARARASPPVLPGAAA